MAQFRKILAIVLAIVMVASFSGITVLAADDSVGDGEEISDDSSDLNADDNSVGDDAGKADTDNADGTDESEEADEAESTDVSSENGNDEDAENNNNEEVGTEETGNPEEPVETETTEETFVLEDGMVATVGDTQYETLQKAIDAAEANDGEKLATLRTDVTENVTITGNVTLDLGGNTITGDADTVDSVVAVLSGTVTIKNGTITGGTTGNYYCPYGWYAYYRGGGLFIEDSNDDNTPGANVTLSNVAIIDNTTKLTELSGSTYSRGGGVYVGNRATLNIESGTKINNNEAKSGSGVYAGYKATLNMDGGSIDYNTGNHGVEFEKYGTFTMNGGSVSHNVSSSYGGGVYMSNATFTMTGGNIDYNETTYYSFFSDLGGGGVFLGSSSTFTMTGGSISYNTARQNGGGVEVAGKSTFDLKDGTICGNHAVSGGGIDIDSSVLNMSGGIICHNSASNGGGVYACFGGPITMSGGTITKNTARVGGGVEVDTHRIIMTGGYIYDNSASTSGDDIDSIYSTGDVIIEAPIGLELEDGRVITGWYWDKLHNRWSDGNITPYESVGEPVTIKSGQSLSLKVGYRMPGEEVTLTVQYVDEAGNSLAESKVDTLEPGAEYSESPIDIEGYVPVDSTTVSGTISKDTTITFTYAKLWTLTVNYVDANGNPVAESTQSTVKNGDEYTTAPVEVTGMTGTLQSGSDPATGTMDGDKEVTYVYTLNRYILTVQFVDENGTKLRDDAGGVYNYGTTYSVNAVAIDGYVYSRLSYSSAPLSGTITANTTVTLIYVTAPEPEPEPEPAAPVYTYYYRVDTHYTATIDGEVVLSETVTGDVQNSGETELSSATASWVNAETSEFSGYTFTLAENSDNGGSYNGTEARPTVFNVYYVYSYATPEYTLTVNYRSDTGETLRDTETSTYKEGAEYATEPYDIEGYELSKTEGEASGIITGDTEVTYIYTAKVVEPETETPNTPTPVDPTPDTPTPAPTTPTTPATPTEPDVDIGDDDVPLSPAPVTTPDDDIDIGDDDVPLSAAPEDIDIGDDDVPLGAVPEDIDIGDDDVPLGATPEDIDIGDDDVPLDAAPSTGDTSVRMSILWSIFALSGIGLCAMALTYGKKEH